MSVSGSTADSPARVLRQDAARNRERVLAAADAVFAERGLEATLADVAEQAGVGVGTIYRRFADKGTLIAALLDDKIAAVTATVADSAAADSGWDGFCRLLSGLSEQLLADRALTEILTTDYGRESAPRLLAALKPAATRLIKRAQAEGALRRDLRFNDLPPLLVMATATADYVGAGNPRSRSRYLEVVLDGLRARPDQPPLPGRALTDAELETANRAAPTRRR